MPNKANFSKSQMFITVVSTMNCNEKMKLDTWSKRTQTKPNLPASSWIPAFAGMTKEVLVVILEIEVDVPGVGQAFLFGQFDLGALQTGPVKLERGEKFGKFRYVNLLQIHLCALGLLARGGYHNPRIKRVTRRRDSARAGCFIDGAGIIKFNGDAIRISELQPIGVDGQNLFYYALAFVILRFLNFPVMSRSRQIYTPNK
jgi:hypothetical protein